MNEKSKELRYQKLVGDRKKCTDCVGLGLTNPATVRDSKFDSNEIGPWTRWNGDLNARILVIGQDWGGVDSFEEQRGHDQKSPTNDLLLNLLASVGIDIRSAPKGGSNTGVFLTNAALCLKNDGTSAPVNPKWFKNCSKFLLAQIELVRPRVVVALGEQAYRGVCEAFTLPQVRFGDAVRCRNPIPLQDGTHLVPVYHCGLKGLRSRKRSEQFADWGLVEALLNDTC